MICSFLKTPPVLFRRTYITEIVVEVKNFETENLSGRLACKLYTPTVKCIILTHFVSKVMLIFCQLKGQSETHTADFKKTLALFESRLQVP